MNLFGGFWVYFLGDFHKLKPVLNRALFSPAYQQHSQSAHGKLMYGEFKKMFFLDQIMQQSGTDQQKELGTVLSNIGNGFTTENDYNVLSKRFVSCNLHLQHEFQNAIRIFTTNKCVFKHNLLQSENLLNLSL